MTGPGARRSIPAARWTGLAGLVVALTGLPALAAPEAHALLMWVGRYGSPALDLPGIEIDAARAREMAGSYGVAPARRLEVSEEALTLRGMVEAFATLERRVAPGDRVFVYFSGHGRQIDGRALGVRCSEGLVTQDAALYLDVALERSLQRLAELASQVVMFNDSCHAGGAAAKSFGERGVAPGEVPKRFVAPVRGAYAGDDGGAACGQAVNKSFAGAWAAGVRAGAGQAGPWLYVAAAAADEIAYAGPAGSRATAAWHRCLVGEGGPMDGEALRACAQRQLDRLGGKRQTVTLLGDARLRLDANGGAGAAATTTSMPMPPPATLRAGPGKSALGVQGLEASGR